MKSLQIFWGRNSSVLEEVQRTCSGGGWGTFGPERLVWLQWKEHWVEQQVMDDFREAKGTLILWGSQAWVRKCSCFLRFFKSSPSTFRRLNFSSHSQTQMSLNDESFFCYLLANSPSSLKEWSPPVPSLVALIVPYRLFWAIKTLGPPAAHTQQDVTLLLSPRWNVPLLEEKTALSSHPLETQRAIARGGSWETGPAGSISAPFLWEPEVPTRWDPWGVVSVFSTGGQGAEGKQLKGGNDLYILST